MISSKNILCFNWNTNQIPLCENYLDNKTQNLISKSRGTFTKTTSCYNPIFFDEIEKEIIRFLPTLQILVFLTEGDLENGTWFHSDFLPNKLANLNLPTTPGQTVNQNIQKFRLLTRDKYFGQPSNNIKTVMRMSIYVAVNDKNTKAVELSKGYILNDNTLDCNGNRKIFGNYQYIESVKVLTLYVESSMGKIAFVGIQYMETNPDQGRLCIKQLEEKFINNKGINHVFIMGDFSNNPGLSINDKSYQYTKLADQFVDEYREESRPTGYVDYKDKNSNNELESYPTYQNGEMIGYHDRILEKSLVPSSNQIKVIEYKIIKGFPINKTMPHHFAVLGIYEVPNLK